MATGQWIQYFENIPIDYLDRPIDDWSIIYIVQFKVLQISSKLKKIKTNKL